MEWDRKNRKEYNSSDEWSEVNSSEGSMGEEYNNEGSEYFNDEGAEEYEDKEYNDQGGEGDPGEYQDYNRDTVGTRFTLANDGGSTTAGDASKALRVVDQWQQLEEMEQAYYADPQNVPKTRFWDLDKISTKGKLKIGAVVVVIMLILTYILVLRPVGIESVEKIGTPGSSDPDLEGWLVNKGMFSVKFSDIEYSVEGEPLKSGKSGDIVDIITSKHGSTLERGDKVKFHINLPGLLWQAPADSLYITLEITWKGMQSSSRKIDVDEYYKDY